MRQETINVKTSKRRKISSTKWLRRQLNDEYVALSKKDGYRSRAAYKLIEIDKKFNLIKPNSNCVDLGAAPGGWTQILSTKVKKGKIVTLDLLEMDELPGVTHITGDFCELEIQDQISNILPQIDLIVSDMAPNTTGHKQTDHLRIIDLCERVCYFSLNLLQKEGSVVVKIFQGSATNDILKLFKQNFKEVKHFKPESSRKGSSEIYLIAKNFKGRDEN